jgi:hypothetical protein
MLASTMVTNLQAELKVDNLGGVAYGWINFAQELLNSMTYWHHLTAARPYQFAFVAPYTTGTVAVTNGSTTVTGSGTAFTAAMVDQAIVFENDDVHYYIASVESSTSLTLGLAYIGTTDASQTFTIHTINYTLPSTISLPKIKDIVIQDPHRKLEYIDQRKRDELAPNLFASTSQPAGYLDWGQSSIQPYPATDAAYVATVRFQKKPTEVSASQTTLDWPDLMHVCIFKLALAQGWRYLDDDQADAVHAEGMAMAQGHMRANNRRGDHRLIMRRFDESDRVGRFGLVLGPRIVE